MSDTSMNKRLVLAAVAASALLAGCGAELVTTEMVCFEWLRSAEHPLFKPMQALIK
mgnify:CR=1 FL=1